MGVKNAMTADFLRSAYEPMVEKVWHTCDI